MRYAFLLLGTVFSAGLAAQSQSAALARFQLAFAREQKTYQNVDEKQSTLAALRKYDSARIARALIDAYAGLEQELTPLQEKRRKLLPRGKSSLTYPLREKLQPIRNLQDSVLAALAYQRSEPSLQAMMRSLLRSKRNLPLTLQIALASRAGEQSSENLNSLLGKVGKKKETEQEILVLLRLFTRLGLRAQGAGPWVLKKLVSRNADIRVEAVRALASLRWPGSLMPLADRISEEHGRLRDLIAETLARFTGIDLGPSRKSWRAWLSTEGSPYLRGDKELGDRLPKKKRAGVEGTGTYFDIPQDGASILYVFDISLSMRAPMKGRYRDGVKGDGPQKGAKGGRRIDVLRKELTRALDGLTPSKRFNLLGFANRLYRFSQVQVPATPKNIKKAKAWLEGLDLEIQTNIYDALELAFVSAGRGSKDRYYPLTADTIFFLSDGMPTRPRSTAKARGRGLSQDKPGEILSAVRRWNPLRLLRIHAIGLGIRGPRAREFLRRLAKQNGGTYVNR